MTLAQGIYPISHSWRWCPTERCVSWSWNLRNLTDQTDCVFFGGVFAGKGARNYLEISKAWYLEMSSMLCWCFSDLSRRISRFDPVGTTSGDVGTLLYRVSEDPKQDFATPGRCKSWQVTGISRKKFDSGYDVWVTRICNLCVYMYVWHAHLHRLSIKALWYDCSKMFKRWTGS